jgi:hypothetical protein
MAGQSECQRGIRRDEQTHGKETMMRTGLSFPRVMIAATVAALLPGVLSAQSFVLPGTETPVTTAAADPFDPAIA